MTRHVFGSHDEVAHVWANDRRSVRHGSGKNVYFEGDTIYSYGSHFPIASFVTAKDGSEVVLFTTRSYSVSTAKHISIVRRAIYHRTIYYVSDPSSRDWRGMVRECLDEAAKLKLKAEKRRSDDWRSFDLGEMAERIAAARFCAEQAGMKLPASDEEAIAKAEKLAAAEQKRLAAERKRREKAERERKEKLEALWDQAKPYWRSFRDVPEELKDEARALGVYSFSNAHGLSIALRRANSDTIETSWGARFPLDHGVRAFRVLKGLWDKGRDWRREGVGPRLGHYTIDSVNSEGVRAGCHFVSRAEVERMAAELEVSDLPAISTQAAA